MLLPVQTVGVMGDGRTYEFVCALRAVTSVDGMTADFYPFDMAFLGKTATRIINEVRGINRVVYDVTSEAAGHDRVGIERRGACQSARRAARNRQLERVVKDNPFSNPASVANYASDTPRKVPGLADLHRMVALLLGERAPVRRAYPRGRAGGGLELKAMAEVQPDWTFTGVDPSAAMLDIARVTVGAHADRMSLIEGCRRRRSRAGPFDGATCLLTLHFIGRGGAAADAAGHVAAG